MAVALGTESAAMTAAAADDEDGGEGGGQGGTISPSEAAYMPTRFRKWVRPGGPHPLQYVLFDYMQGHVSVAVAPWSRDYSEITHLLHRSLVRLHDHGVRSRESRGLVEVHIVAIPRGGNTRWKVFPMRHLRTEIVHGLWGVVWKVAGMLSTDPAFESTVADELQQILDMDPQFIYE
ncbi:hypothetical protein B0H16DRAFT_1690034 [Mycena metata]|uniref:Uncharacterized protein n=1 Tax=Mycena metata TaxID=1033252 RepID=A0AAD7J7V4_9AGAR|nr:hypothetical protein B0H16DRAFT_1690034 [Mycena metata]